MWVNTGRMDDFDRASRPTSISRSHSAWSRSSWGWDTKFGDFDNDGVSEALRATGFIAGKG